MRSILLLLFTTLIAHQTQSQERIYGDWGVVTITELDIVMAATVNDDDTSAGAICDTDGCYPFVNLRISCEEEVEYPFLISFDVGILYGSTSCTILEDTYLFGFGDDVLEKMMTSSRMGVAYGLEDGTFKATYFSLSGSTKSVIEARKRVQEFNKNSTKRGSVPLQ